MTVRAPSTIRAAVAFLVFVAAVLAGCGPSKHQRLMSLYDNLSHHWDAMLDNIYAATDATDHGTRAGQCTALRLAVFHYHQIERLTASVEDPRVTTAFKQWRRKQKPALFRANDKCVQDGELGY